MQIDARDLLNPRPAAMTFDALINLQEGDSLTVIVNQGKAVDSIVRLAQQKNCRLELDDNDGFSTIKLTPKQSLRTQSPTEEALLALGVTTSEEPIVLFGSETLGEGNRMLGEVLARELIFDFANQEIIPSVMYFYNSAVKLCCEGSQSLRDLTVHLEQGTEIMVDEVSLDAYDLANKLEIGESVPPYVIADVLFQHGGKVIKL